jgi:hypothetical protein
VNVRVSCRFGAVQAGHYVCTLNHASQEEQVEELSNPQQSKSEQPNHTRPIATVVEAMQPRQANQARKPKQKRNETALQESRLS